MTTPNSPYVFLDDLIFCLGTPAAEEMYHSPLGYKVDKIRYDNLYLSPLHIHLKIKEDVSNFKR